MVDIQITHDTGREVTLTMPENYNEVSPILFRKLIKVFALKQEDFFKYAAIIYLLSGKNAKEFKGMKPREIEALTEHVAWTTRLSEMCFAQSKLSRWLFCKGPGEYMLDLTVNQFEDADTCLEELAEEGSNGLDCQKLLFAVLYRPFYIPYSRWFVVNVWSRIAPLLVRQITLEVALLNYIGLRKGFSQLFPETFNGGGEKSQLSIFGLDVLIDNVAGDKLGNIDQVRNRKLREVFVHIESAIVQANKMKQPSSSDVM